MTLLFHTLHPSVSSSLLIQEKECPHCVGSAKPISVLHSLVCGERGGTNAALPGMSRSHIQLALVHCLAAPVHWVGGWQQRQARWVHPPVTSQRQTVRFLSQSACFHSDVQRLSRREALRRWGNPGWEESPEETRGKNVLKDSNFYAIVKQFLSLKGPVCIFFF